MDLLFGPLSPPWKLSSQGGKFWQPGASYLKQGEICTSSLLPQGFLRWHRNLGVAGNSNLLGQSSFNGRWRSVGKCPSLFLPEKNSEAQSTLFLSGYPRGYKSQLLPIPLSSLIFTSPVFIPVPHLPHHLPSRCIYALSQVLLLEEPKLRQ